MKTKLNTTTLPFAKIVNMLSEIMFEKKELGGGERGGEGSNRDQGAPPRPPAADARLRQGKEGPQPPHRRGLRYDTKLVGVGTVRC